MSLAKGCADMGECENQARGQSGTGLRRAVTLFCRGRTRAFPF